MQSAIQCEGGFKHADQSLEMHVVGQAFSTLSLGNCQGSNLTQTILKLCSDPKSDAPILKIEYWGEPQFCDFPMTLLCRTGSTFSDRGIRPR